MQRIIEVLEDALAIQTRSTELVVAKIQKAIELRGRSTLVLAGGSTPKALYQSLAQQNLPWEKIQIFWGDERYVASNHPDSNQKMAREAWLDLVDFPASNIHPIPTSANDPELDAQSYETEIKACFGSNDREFPSFDIILLGMGDDGHTASLFPYTKALEVCDRLVTVGNKDGQPRLTFTIPLIDHAKCVIFLVTGANKQTALEQIFANDSDSRQYPSRFIQPQGELWWLLDRAAGSSFIDSF
jgi:6-phosphogluconolactonase